MGQLMLFNTTRKLSEPPSTGAAAAAVQHSAQTSGPQGPLSLWTKVWPTQRPRLHTQAS